MASAFQSGAASALLDVLFNKVTDVLIREGKLILNSDEAMRRLELTIVNAQDLLDKIDTSEMRGSTKIVVQTQVDYLTSLAYDADDLTGDILSLTNCCSNSCKKPVRNGILISGNWSMGREIENLQNKLDTILEELKKHEGHINKPESERMVRIIPQSTLFGRGKDVAAIMEDLLSCNSQFQGVSIVGMDGLGKTKLAQAIKKEATLTNRFSTVLWVYVDGGNFNFSDVITKLPPVDNNVPNQGDSSIFIIFDNLLKVTLRDWTDMWGHITQIYKYIRFLITTFSASVVKNTRTRSHYLKPLCDEDCKKVIAEIAQSFDPNISELHNLNDVTLALAKNSGGLPSVARLLGAILGQHGVDEVRTILRNGLWDSDVFQEEIFPNLKLCYSKIQSHLKPHFAYFSLFPTKYAFTVDELVHLWVGAGFIQHSESLINKGKKHFDELQRMSILQCSDQRNENGNSIFELNQYSHKFAQLAASKTCLRLAQGVSTNYTDTRHLSLCYSNNCPPNWEDLEKFKVLRTIFAQSKSNIGKIPPSIFKKLTRLRVLSLSGSNVSELPNTIECLTNLRYLDISHTRIKSLPGSLCKLHALQFLKLRETTSTLKILPQGFQSLTNLIYLDWDVDDIRKLGLPPHIGKLSSLQTLPLFPVGNTDGHHISEMAAMNHLQGSIRIENLENVKDWAASRIAALHKKSFTQIELEWKKPKNPSTDKEVLSCLKPGKMLKQLKITNYHGDIFPDWMTDSLPELEKMHLERCPNVQGLPEKGSLHKLKVLVLEKLSNVMNVDLLFFGEGHFRMLESLEIMLMEQLQAWNVGPESNVMPHLQVLKFRCCPKLINVSSLEHLSSLKELEIQRCEALSSLPDLPISLKALRIEESDLLSGRCQEGGDDWTKVSSIPDVENGYKKITITGS